VSPSIALFQLATFAPIPATNRHTTVSLFAIVHPMNAGSWLGKTHVCSDADTDVLTSMVSPAGKGNATCFQVRFALSKKAIVKVTNPKSVEA